MAEHGHEAHSGLDIGSFFRHGIIAKAWKEALKIAGITATTMIVAPAILCATTGIVLPNYITASASATIVASRWAEKIQPSKKKTPEASQH